MEYKCPKCGMSRTLKQIIEDDNTQVIEDESETIFSSVHCGWAGHTLGYTCSCGMYAEFELSGRITDVFIRTESGDEMDITLENGF